MTPTADAPANLRTRISATPTVDAVVTRLIRSGADFTHPANVMTNLAEQLEAALRRIVAIENKDSGGDWDEIEEARQIALNVLEIK